MLCSKYSSYATTNILTTKKARRLSYLDCTSTHIVDRVMAI